MLEDVYTFSYPATNKVRCVSVCEPGYCAIGHDDGQLTVYDPDGEVILSSKMKSGISSLSICEPPALKLVVGLHTGSLRLYDLHSPSTPVTLSPQHRVEVTAACWAKSQALFATGSLVDPVRVWSGQGREVARIDVGQKVTALCLTPNNWLVIGDATGVVTIYNIRSSPPELVQTIAHRPPVLSVAMHPIDRVLAVASGDRTARCWSVGKVWETLYKTNAIPGGVGHVVFTPEGWLCCCGGRSLTIWDKATMQSFKQITGTMKALSVGVGVFGVILNKGEARVIAFGRVDGAPLAVTAVPAPPRPARPSTPPRDPRPPRPAGADHLLLAEEVVGLQERSQRLLQTKQQASKAAALWVKGDVYGAMREVNAGDARLGRCLLRNINHQDLRDPDVLDRAVGRHMLQLVLTELDDCEDDLLHACGRIVAVIVREHPDWVDDIEDRLKASVERRLADGVGADVAGVLREVQLLMGG